MSTPTVYGTFALATQRAIVPHDLDARAVA
jgi:hypothetical protein